MPSLLCIPGHDVRFDLPHPKLEIGRTPPDTPLNFRRYAVPFAD